MNSRPKLTVVAFGDSITEATHQEPEGRWPEILKRALQERFATIDLTMVNSGVGGNTTREGLRRFEKDVLAYTPQFVLVEFGNDATPEPERHVTIDEFIRNLELIREGIAKCHQGITILLTFPPVIDQWHAYRDHEFYRKNGGQDACQELYRAATRNFALEHGMPLADIDLALRKEMAIRGPGDCILPDGVHLTQKGNQCVAETVMMTLAPEVEKWQFRVSVR